MDLAIPTPPMETAILWQTPLNSSSLECTNAFIFFFLLSIPPLLYPSLAGPHTLVAPVRLYNCVYYNIALVPVYIWTDHSLCSILLWEVQGFTEASAIFHICTSMFLTRWIPVGNLYSRCLWLVSQIGTNACLVAVAMATCSSIIETESIGAADEQGQWLHKSSSSVHCLWPSMWQLMAMRPRVNDLTASLTWNGKIPIYQSPQAIVDEAHITC